jgi:hypothetical protein
MGKRKRASLFLATGSVLLVLVLLGWFLFIIFEGEKPGITLRPLPDFLSGSQEFGLTVSDMKRGLRVLEVSVKQEGRKITVLEKTFPFKGLLNRQGVNSYNTRFSIDPHALNLAQGRVDLEVRVRDYSRRSGGDGNLSLVEHKIVVDTIPPAIRALSRMNYVNVGGAGLVVYQTSSDTVESGLFVNESFYPGFQAGGESREGLNVCYFAVPHETKAQPEIYLWAKDKAENISKASFYCHIRSKRFRKEKINISDRFLGHILPYFSFCAFDPQLSNLEKFLKINQELRKENNSVFFDLKTETGPERLWKGTWIRLKNAATMARFGDRRFYYYKGEKIDEQVHLGVDLASLANSEVQASNNGRVIFRDRLGIYGLTVVLDHGQGIASVYSHLSEIRVAMGQEVMKGEVIGLTGQTGLAGGDHLHFGIMVNGMFVNPIEWWDSHWIHDNVTRKLEILDRQ